MRLDESLFVLVGNIRIAGADVYGGTNMWGLLSLKRGG
jgi:hypothetical protein